MRSCLMLILAIVGGLFGVRLFIGPPAPMPTATSAVPSPTALAFSASPAVVRTFVSTLTPSALTATLASTPNVPFVIVTPGGPGQVRVINAAPETPAIDVYLDRRPTPFVANLAYGSASRFISVLPQEYVITVRTAGASANVPALFQRNFTISSNSALNIVAVGQVSRQGSRGFLLLLIPANIDSTVGMARVQLIHAAPETGAIDLLLNNQVTVNALLYGDGLLTGFNVQAGTYNLRIVPTDRSQPVLVEMPNTALAPNTLYTLILTGTTSNLHPLLLADATRPAMLITP